MTAMHKSAKLSSDRVYRYQLFRGWGDGPSMVTFIGLNPSTADGTEDDPTIRRCIGFARDWGYDAVQMLNLFAFRATYPKDLKLAEAPVGPINDVYLSTAASYPGIVIAAWGTVGAYKDRAQYVRSRVSPLYCLGTNSDGSPCHPLYLKKNTPLEVYSL